LLSSVAAGKQLELHTPVANLWFDPPSEQAPMHWMDSCVVLLRRSTAEVRVKASRNSYGTIDVPCEVTSSSIPRGPKNVVIRFGLNMPPGPIHSDDWPQDRAKRFDAAVPRSETYLAILSKPKKLAWGDLDLAVPRLFVPLTSQLRVSLGQARMAALLAIFQALRSSDSRSSARMIDWLDVEWHVEAKGLSKGNGTIHAGDNRLVALSGDENDEAIGEAALREANRAGSTAHCYLTLLAGMWGCEERFTPFFKSCEDNRSLADPGLLEKLVADPPFLELSLDEGVSLAKKVSKQYVGVVLKFVRPNSKGGLTQKQRKELYQLTARLSSPDRLAIYSMMVTGLPPEMIAWYPNGLIPPYKSDGSIPGESGYRQKWEGYLGLSGSIKP